MSNVKLAGNVSGTGSVTIASPNTNSDRTITLPDSSGTFVVDGASQSPTFNAVTTTTLSVAGNNISAVNSMGNRNRIINGDMRIDQRNAGASITIAASGSGYPVDRFRAANQTDGTFTVQQSTVAPVGFTNSVVATVTATDSSIGATQYAQLEQRIEGFNVADLGWGTANAQAVTISFQVRSSLTGTFCLALYNSNGSRCYVATYTVNSANTWESEAITVPGDTAGTWQTGSSTGIDLIFTLAVGSTYQQAAGAWGTTSFAIGTSGQTNFLGTNGATFYITGVQLEAGSVATPFERRPYGTELQLCSRYYQLIQNMAGTSGSSGGTLIYCSVPLPVEMRATPSAGQTGVFNFDQPFVGNWTQSSGNVTIISAASSARGLFLNLGNFSGVTANVPLNKAGNTNALTLTAEL